MTLEELADLMLVNHIRQAMTEKLLHKRNEGRGGWWKADECSNEHLFDMAKKHMERAESDSEQIIDVINLLAMVHCRVTGKIQPLRTDDEIKQVSYSDLPPESNELVDLYDGRELTLPDGRKISIWRAEGKEGIWFIIKRPVNQIVESVLQFRLSDEAAMALWVLLGEKIVEKNIG